MTPEEAVLEAAKVNASVWKDLIKVGIPSLVALISSCVTYILAKKLKESDERMAEKSREFQAKLASLEASHASSATFMESRRAQLEKASECYDLFAGKVAVLYTQIIAKLKKLESNESVGKELEKLISVYEKESWSAFADANRAKRILKLNGLNETADLLVKSMSHASSGRAAYHEYVQGKRAMTATEIDNHFQDFRKHSDLFYCSLSHDYKRLVIA